NPVCTSATKKTNQSSPRWLGRDGCGWSSLVGAGATGPDGEASGPGSGVLRPIWRAWMVTQDAPQMRSIGRQRGRGTQNDNGALALVFRWSLHLFARQVDDDDIALSFVRFEVQGVPVDGNLAAADTEEPAEVDDGGTGTAGPVDHDIDQPAHIFVRLAANLLAKNALGLLGTKHRHGSVAVLPIGLKILAR